MKILETYLNPKRPDIVIMENDSITAIELTFQWCEVPLFGTHLPNLKKKKKKKKNICKNFFKFLLKKIQYE